MTVFYGIAPANGLALGLGSIIPLGVPQDPDDLVGNLELEDGANLLLVTSGGRRGRAPIIDGSSLTDYADPLPQALALTAIVITFGITAFLLALGYRSWQLTGDDRVEDDVEDRMVERWDADHAESEHADFDPDAELSSDLETNEADRA